jgi:hypothetical protein
LDDSFNGWGKSTANSGKNPLTFFLNEPLKAGPKTASRKTIPVVILAKAIQLVKLSGNG